MANGNLTDLDRKLQEMALTNWPQFVQMIGPEAIIAAKVCLLRQENMKYAYICKVLNITKNQVQYACDKCEGNS